jgi:ligand-binding sensor domain-containing protein
VVDVNAVKWFATDKGIVSFDGQTWTSYADDQNLTTGSIHDFCVEQLLGANKIWLGTNLGLTYFDFGASPATIKNYKSAEGGILSDTLSAIAMDNASTKFIGTTKGLSILKENNWYSYYGRSAEKTLLRFKISSIAIGQSGYIYAATAGGGVSRFKYADAISGETTFNKPWAWGLPSDTVYAVATDGDEQWYGTNRGVAYHTTEFTKQDWVTYTRENGLVCDSVYAIAKDFLGNIWFGTHKGVSRLSGETWQNYTTKDGMIADKVNTIALDADGSLWFGTDEGISHFTDNHWVNF